MIYVSCLSFSALVLSCGWEKQMVRFSWELKTEAKLIKDSVIRRVKSALQGSIQISNPSEVELFFQNVFTSDLFYYSIFHGKGSCFVILNAFFIFHKLEIYESCTLIFLLLQLIGTHYANCISINTN